MLIALTPLAAQNARRGFSPPPPSEELAKQPQTKGAVGDQDRHYYFAEAKQEMPYHLYVPKSYKPGTKMPLVVALHGYGGNQDYFSVLVKDLPELLETARLHLRGAAGLLGGRLVWRSAEHSAGQRQGKGQSQGPGADAGRGAAGTRAQ